MATQTYRLEIQVDAQKAQDALLAVKKRMDIIEQATGDAGQGITRFNDNVNDAARSLDKFVSGSKPVQQNLAKLKNNIDETTSASKRLDNSLKGLSPTLGGVAAQMAGIFTVSTAISKMDAFTGLQNRLKLVTKSTDELNQAMQATFKIAQNTGSDWDSAVLVFQKFSENAERLNLDLAKTAKLTDTVSKAVAISGSSAEGAAAALTQFGQGLGSGVLRGDEFNSVNENANGIIKALAYGLGVTSGELRTMANEGKLTGEVLAEALDKAKPYIDEMFSKTDFTIGQSMQMLSNSMTQFVGEAGKASGAASALSGAIQLLANNFNAVADTTMVAGITYATYAITQKTQSVYASITALLAERAANAQKAQSELAAAQSELATTQAKLAKVQASYKSVAALRGEAMAQAQLTAATNAATQAQINLGKAKKAVAATAGGMRGVMAGLAGVMGGPMGLALMVGGVAASYMLLKDNTQKADAGLETNKKTVAELLEEYQKLNENQKQLARDQITKDIKERTQAYKDQINELTILTARIANNSEATAEQKAEIFAAMQALRGKTISAEELAVKVRGMGVASEDFAIKLTKQASETQKAKDELDHAESIGRAYENTAYNASNASSGLADQMDNVAGAASNATDKMEGLTQEAKKYLDTISQNAFVDRMTLEMMKRGYSEKVSRDLARFYVANGKKKITPDIEQAILDGAQAQEDLEKYIKSTKPKSNNSSKAKTEAILITAQERAAWDKVKQNAIKYDFASIEKQYNLPSGILASVHMQESKGNANAVGSETKYGRAKGGFQFLDGTWQQYGKGSVYDLANAAPAAAKYLRHLIDEFGDVEKAIAAYNTGPGNVKKHAWSTIMSDRYARMKNGKGQTFHYVKGVSRYMQAYNGGKDQAYTANEVAEQAANYAKQQADLAKKQEEARESLLKQYGTWSYRQAEQLKEEIKAINNAFGESSETAKKLTAIANERYAISDKLRQKEQQLEMYSHKMTTTERMALEHEIHQHKILLNGEYTEAERTAYRDAANEKYQHDLAMFKRLQQQKIQELEKPIKAALDEQERIAIARMNQKTMRPDDYRRWELSQEMAGVRRTADDAYGSQFREIFRRNDSGQYEIESREERFRLWEEAYRLHKETIANIDAEYGEKSKVLEDELLSAKLSAYGSAAGALAGLFKDMSGEQSKAYRAMFHVSKAFAIAEAGKNVWLAASDAFTKEPGTVWQKLAAAATATAKSSSFIPLINAINPKGFKSGGYTGNIGVNSIAGVVHGQEYVMNAKATKRIGVNNLERLSNGEGIGGVKVIINNYSNETATAEQMPNGDIMVTIGKAARYIAKDEIQKYHQSQLRQGGIYYGR